MTTTQNQISRIAQDWSKIAKEPVKVENVSGTIYGFCSEIAALRLANKYRNEKPIVGGIRFLCETVEETLSLIKSFNGDGWVITTFLIDYEGDDGIIIDSRFKQYSL